MAVPQLFHKSFLVGATEFLFHPLRDTQNQFFIGAFGAVGGATSLLFFLRDARNLADRAHGCLHFNMPALGFSIRLQFDRKKIDFVNPHLYSADREVSLSV